LGLAATAGLGAVAGLTIFLGLPIGRIGRARPGFIAYITATSVGVLIFILYDVIRNASETIVGALDTNRWTGIGYGLLLAAGLAAGTLGMLLVERTRKRGAATKGLPSGPGAMAVSPDAPEAERADAAHRAALTPAAQLALYISIGIGLHNFSEGLAIGESAAVGAFQLFYLLVIGFGLHNMTEGFGITGPLVGRRPSWRFLALCGLIAGGPTFLGTIVGHQFASPALEVLFLALAAGAIIYVVGELQHAGRRIGSHSMSMLGLLSGFLVAYGTDLVLHVAGA